MALSTSSFAASGGAGNSSRLKSSLDPGDHNNNIEYASGGGGGGGKLSNPYRIDTAADEFRINRSSNSVSDVSRNPSTDYRASADFRSVAGYNTSDYRGPVRDDYRPDFRPSGPSNANGRGNAEYSPAVSRASSGSATQGYPGHFWNYGPGGKR